jgi:hypothetical protein
MTGFDRLDRVVDAELAGWAPASAPPFAQIVARRRRSDRRRAAGLAGVLVLTLAGAAALVPLFQSRAEDRLDSAASDTPAQGPELGRVPTPADLLAALPSESGRGGTPRPGETVDLLARHVDGAMTVGTYGWLDGSLFCKANFVSEPSYGQVPVEPATCGPTSQDFDRLAAARALGLRSGGVLKQVIWGTAPNNTDRLRLSGPGQDAVEVPAYFPGEDWPRSRWFVATWPANSPLTVAALAADGTVLATKSL